VVREFDSAQKLTSSEVRLLHGTKRKNNELKNVAAAGNGVGRILFGKRTKGDTYIYQHYNFSNFGYRTSGFLSNARRACLRRTVLAVALQQ